MNYLNLLYAFVCIIASNLITYYLLSIGQRGKYKEPFCLLVVLYWLIDITFIGGVFTHLMIFYVNLKIDLGLLNTFIGFAIMIFSLSQSVFLKCIVEKI